MSFLVPTTGRGSRYILTIVVLLVAGMVLGQIAIAGIWPTAVGSGILVMLASVAASGSFVACRRAARGPGAADRRVWRLFAAGLASWAIGGPLYVTFLLLGGDFMQPAFWSQVGFLGAYPFWYRALWLLRQPTVARGRLRRLEAAGLEAVALVTTIVLVAAILWVDWLPVAANLSQLTPVTLDLLLGAALYNAARRTVLSRDSAYLWFLAGFASLAITDGMVSFLIGTGEQVPLGAALALYPIPMAILGWASTKGLQVTDARRDLSSSHLMLGMGALAMIGPVSWLTPHAWRIGWWALAGLVIWRLSAHLFRRSEIEGDLLTGMLDGRAFERYLAGLVLGAGDGQPAVVVGVDMNGFAAWNQRHGFGAGDELLVEVAGLLGARSEFADGVWGRLGADLFVWAGVGAGHEQARGLAQVAATTASDNRRRVGARSGVVLAPRDARTVADALAALDEALAAASSSGRAVVAFDRGELDGLPPAADGDAAARRRDRIQRVLADPQAIRSVVQPIVSLSDGRVVGHEALSRFAAEPRRGPDVWIAEAASVGLGLDLEAACLRRALERRDQMPEGTYLSVNASGELIGSALLHGILAGRQDLSWLVIEITEHEKIEDYPALIADLAPYRGRGARVAIDDAGAGHSSMRHILELEPDLVKLDRSLIGGADGSEGQQAMIASLVSFTARTGAGLVAEGVESDEELAVLGDLGVGLGQGYGIGRPDDGFRAGRLIAAAPAAIPEGRAA